MKRKPAGAATAPYLSAMGLVNSRRPKQAAASESNWPVRSACGLGEMPWQPRPSLTLNEPHEHRCCCARVRGPAENRVLGRLPCPSDRPCERRAGRLLACARQYPSRTVCAMGAFVGISPCRLKVFYRSIRRPTVSNAAPGNSSRAKRRWSEKSTAGPPFDKESASVANIATSTSTSQPMPIFLSI